MQTTPFFCFFGINYAVTVVFCFVKIPPVGETYERSFARVE